MSIRIGLLTTLSTNIGDDFIRDGIINVVMAITPNKLVNFTTINKHEPNTVYPAWHPIRLSYRNGFVPRRKLGPVRRFAESWLPSLGFSRLDSCDLIVQCGTPVIWEGCRNSEWARLIWRDVLARVARGGKPVLNLGGGSAYPWERQPTTLVGSPDEPFVRLMLKASRSTTVRDRLARHLFASLGCQAEQVCCPAMLAGQTFVVPTLPKRKVVINYMHGGGHFDLGQEIDAGVWEKTMRQVVTELQKESWELLFLAHNAKEAELAGRIWPDFPCVLPINQREYFESLRDAAFGVFNRMHASVAAAGIGIPSVAVGTDTRNLMIEALGLPVLYVKDASPSRLRMVIRDLINHRSSEAQRLLKLRQVTFDTYKELLRPFLGTPQILLK